MSNPTTNWMLKGQCISMKNIDGSDLPFWLSGMHTQGREALLRSGGDNADEVTHNTPGGRPPGGGADGERCERRIGY